MKTIEAPERNITYAFFLFRFCATALKKSLKRHGFPHIKIPHVPIMKHKMEKNGRRGESHAKEL
jgi:hypothetical protein